MHVELLNTHNFRNLVACEMELACAPVVIRGANGQGKTNLLEALYVCATGRSFRNAAPGELLAHNTREGRLRARVLRHGVRHDVVVHIEPRRRAIQVDGRGLRHVARLLELLNVVAFFPDDLRIAKGSPEERRRFLDRAVANHRADFVEAALCYAKALKARNALLKAPRAPDRLLLSSYDEQLVRYGAVLDSSRRLTLAALVPLAVQHFARIMGEPLSLAIELSAGIPEGPDNFAERFLRGLAQSFAKDRARGMTSVGPHRADLLLYLGGKDVRKVASQGQQRAIVLALKLAEVDYLRAQLGAAPILLLDDVSSELDKERTEHLFAALAELDSQVWVSTTGAVPLPLPPAAQVFTMHEGKLERAA